MYFKITLNRLILFLNWVFALFPISFIAGNLVLNIHFLIFLILGFIYLIKKKPEINFNLILCLFLFLSIILILSTVLNDANITKSIFYLRFFAFCFISYFLLKEKLFNIKNTFLFYSFIVLIICIDTIIQHFLGYNIVGIKSHSFGQIQTKVATSFFLDEKVTGSFIQNFGFYLVFAIFYKIKKNNFISIILKSFLISLISIAIFVSFQRVPMMIWIIFLFSYGIIYYKKRLTTVLISLVIFSIFVNNFGSKQLLNNYKSFFINVSQIVNLTEKNYKITKDKKHFSNKAENTNSDKIVLDLDTAEVTNPDYQGQEDLLKLIGGSGHANIYANSLLIWKDNKFLGIGQKNFYNKCAENKFHRCANHPHNYYLEVLTTTGIVGFLFFIFFLISILLKTIYSIKIYYNKKNSFKFDILFLALINFLMFFFPLKSTGSFFTTTNSTYMVITLVILLSQLQKINSKNNFLNFL